MRGSQHHRDMLAGLMSCVGRVGYRRENKEYPINDWNVSSLPGIESTPDLSGLQPAKEPYGCRQNR